jgi:hypothetical protein
MTTKPACRIYVIKAAASPVAAVFRRGPSKQVQVLKWDMETDVFTPGRWFKGRIYERRCDVSPSGDYLIYFAAKWNHVYCFSAKQNLNIVGYKHANLSILWENVNLFF